MADSTANSDLHLTHGDLEQTAEEESLQWRFWLKTTLDTVLFTKVQWKPGVEHLEMLHHSFETFQ